MRKARHIIQALFYGFFGVVLTIPLRIYAYDLNFDPTSGGVSTPLKIYTKLGDKDPAGIVITIVNTSLIFLGMITVILVIVAGFLWLFAAGQEEKIKKAKDLLRGGIMGLIIVMAAYGLAQYIFYALQYATTGATQP